MIECKYVILGAGPAGLACAHTLLGLGESSFVVIEKENVAGGLCRSLLVDNGPIDIGGGHFLDVANVKALDFIFKFLPREQWQYYDRISKIEYKGQLIDYPFEANIWQLPLEEQVLMLESVAKAGCVQDLTMPHKFEDWIVWKLGSRIADEYLLPYNRKIWSVDLSTLGTYWLHKLPNVSFCDMLRSCLEHKPYGSIPAHAKFYYPKSNGYGAVWCKMGELLGERLLTSCPVTSINIDKLIVNNRYKCSKIINSIPWTEWTDITTLPSEICTNIQLLKYASIDIDYYHDHISSDSHWIYNPNASVPFHRVLCRSNFCAGSRGYWTETNSSRAQNTTGWRYKNKYAYPINTIDKPSIIEKILSWSKSINIIGLGRWGTWEHMNSDMAVTSGINLAHKLVMKHE